MSELVPEIESILSGAWVGVLIAIFGIVISLTNYFYTRKKDRFNSLFQTFSYLNNDVNREARRVIYYHDKPNGDLEISAHIMRFDALSNNKEELVRVSSDIVVNNFDQIGLMIKNGLIPEEEFLDRYWKSIIDCRWQLNAYVDKLRINREYPDYLKDFDNLRDRACNYAMKKSLFQGKWKDKGKERCPNLKRDTR